MSSQAPYLSGGPFDGRQAWWPVHPGYQRMRLPMPVKLSVCSEDCTLEVAVYELEERWWIPLPLVAGAPRRRVYVYVFKGME